MMQDAAGGGASGHAGHVVAGAVAFVVELGYKEQKPDAKVQSDPVQPHSQTQAPEVQRPWGPQLGLQPSVICAQ